MVKRILMLVLMACGVTTCVAGPASAASFVAGTPLRTALDGQLSCVVSSADGSLVAWQERMRTIRAGALGDPASIAAIGTSDRCPAAALAADGSAALAAQADVGGESGLQLALRPAGGAFSPLAAVKLPAGVFSDASGLAAGGGVVAVGASRQQGDRSVPVLLVRQADGSLRAVPLPGGAGNARTSEDLVGPLAGVDGAGRGVVVWGATHAVGGQLLAAGFDAAGTLGRVQVLAADGVDTALTDPSLAVDRDGHAAVGWTSGKRTSVVAGMTTGGFDPATSAATSLHWQVAVEPHGAAVAVDASYDGRRGRVRIATRAAGKEFSAPRAYRAGQLGDQPSAIAIDHGRQLVAFAATPTIGSPELGLLQAVTGPVGARPRPAVTIPIASAHVPETVAALPPDGPPTVLTTSQRYTETAGSVRGDRFEIDAFRFSPRPPHRPRGVRVRIAPSQPLGRPQAVRVRVTCPHRCSVRVAGDLVSGNFDASRTLQPGTTLLRVPYSSGGGSAPFKPLRATRRARLGIAVDDATGELRVQRTVVVRP